MEEPKATSGRTYGACDEHEHARVARAQRIRRNVFLFALVSASAVVALAATCLKNDAADARSVALLYGNIVLQDNLATIQNTMPSTYAQPYEVAQQTQPPTVAQQATIAIAAANTAVGMSRTNTQFPMGYFSGVPVWREKTGAAYVDQPQVVPTKDQPLRAAYHAYGYPQLQYSSYPQVAQRPAQYGYPQMQPPLQPGLAVGLTGDAAAQFGAAYGAAFASTLNALIARKGAVAVKQEAMGRLRVKAASARAPAPAPVWTQPSVRVSMSQQGWHMPPVARTGTAVVEQALMTPGEIQEQQQRVVANYNGPSINIKPATGGATIQLNPEQESAFRIDSQGKASDSETEEPAGAGDVGMMNQDPLGAARGAVDQAVAASMQAQNPARMTSLTEMI